MRLQYLVTGTGRCGTAYMARFFTALGYGCGHEAVFTFTGLADAEQKLTSASPVLETSICSRWNHVTQEAAEGWFEPAHVVAESSYMAAPYLDCSLLDGVQVVHLQRQPLAVLSSLVMDMHFFDPTVESQTPYRQFVLQHRPNIAAEPTEIEQAARYILEWTRLITATRRPRLVVRIEDYPYPALLQLLGVAVERLPETGWHNRKINSWATRCCDLALADIPAGATRDEFYELCESYRRDTCAPLPSP